MLMTASLTTTDTAYIDLVKRAVLDSLYTQDEYVPTTGYGRLLPYIRRYLASKGLVVCQRVETQGERRREGHDWPARAFSMIGTLRMDNLQQCVETVLKDGIPGDLIETGVWRGGSTIVMQAILKTYGATDRRVWVADSFEGLPKPNETDYPADRGDDLYSFPELAVSLEQVQAHFRRFGLLDENVRFLKGWFKDTLPTAPIARLAVMRLDGDMYESTMDTLKALYPKLSRGGFCIIDDYGGIPACKQAVHDYRDRHGIQEPIQQIDAWGVYWRLA